MYCFNWKSGRIAGAIIPVPVALRQATGRSGFELQDWSSGGTSFPGFTPESGGNSPQTLADSRRLTDNNIEAGRDSIPVVAYLGVATGRNGVASELGARDLVRLLPARGSLFLFGSSRKCDRIFGHSLLNAAQFTEIQKTERNRRCQHDFPVHWRLRSLSRRKYPMSLQCPCCDPTVSSLPKCSDRPTA